MNIYVYIIHNLINIYIYVCMHACMDIYNTYIYNVYNVSPISRQPSWVLVPTPDIRPATANTFSRLGKEKVNGKDDIPYIMENKKYLKRPTSDLELVFTTCWYCGRNPAPNWMVFQPYKEWDVYHLSTRAGFLPSTVSSNQSTISLVDIYIYTPYLSIFLVT